MSLDAGAWGCTARSGRRAGAASRLAVAGSGFGPVCLLGAAAEDARPDWLPPSSWGDGSEGVPRSGRA
jgi:hypothetical protein